MPARVRINETDAIATLKSRRRRRFTGREILSLIYTTVLAVARNIVVTPFLSVILPPLDSVVESKTHKKKKKTRKTKAITPCLKHDMRWKVSSMGALVRARTLAKGWAQRARSSSDEALGEEASIQRAQTRVTEELQRQMISCAVVSMDDPMAQKVLGERLHPLVRLAEPRSAGSTLPRPGKITGMLLDGVPDDDLRKVLESRDAAQSATALCQWVGEAHGVLRDAWLNTTLAAPPPSPFKGRKRRDVWALSQHVDALNVKLLAASASEATVLEGDVEGDVMDWSEC